MPASNLTPGTDIKSTKKPAGLLELAHLLQADELAISADNRPDNIQITYDAEAATATISATLPIAYTLDVSGRPVATATDYLLNLT